MNSRFAQVDGRFAQIDQKFNWVIGITVTSWTTTMTAIVALFFHHSAPGGMSERVPFGRLLRDFRVGVGLTQDELAERARMSAGGISVLERGIRTAPRRETIALLSSALGLSEADHQRLEESAARPPRARRRNTGVEREDDVNFHNLPLALNSFLGREQERDHILKQLSQRRLVTICGVGGVGKSRLALETARHLAGSFPLRLGLAELSALEKAASKGGASPRALASRNR